MSNSIPRGVRKDSTNMILELEKQGKCKVKKLNDCLLISAIPPFTKEEIMSLIFEDKFENKGK